jgi:hypothetical protein
MRCSKRMRTGRAAELVERLIPSLALGVLTRIANSKAPKSHPVPDRFKINTFVPEIHTICCAFLVPFHSY